MLAKIAPSTNDFHALARYLVNGKSTSAPNPNRVAWTMGYNLPDDDPELAAKIMEATAEMSARTKNAAYHVMIAWHEREKPKPEVMQEIAVKTLELAGLGDHQALIMGHGDRPHKHLHMAINRVNPETGKAWKTSHDYVRFERIMEKLSEQHGFAYVPSHTYNPELTDDQPKKPNSNATYAAKRGADTRRPQWSGRKSRAFADRINDGLDLASTWDDLHDALAAHDLTLEEKGEGYVVGDTASYTKLSSLGLAKTAHGFSKHFVKREKPIFAIDTAPARRRRPVFTVDEIDMARIFVNMGILDQDAVREAVDQAVTARQERAGDMSVAEKLSHRALATTVLSRKVKTTPAKSAAKSAHRKRAHQSTKRR